MPPPRRNSAWQAWLEEPTKTVYPRLTKPLWEWVEQRSSDAIEVWSQCPRADWLEWGLTLGDRYHRHNGILACACLREAFALFAAEPEEVGRGVLVALDEIETWTFRGGDFDAAEAYAEYCFDAESAAKKRGRYDLAAAAYAVASGTYLTRGTDDASGPVAVMEAANALALAETPAQKEPELAALDRAHAKLLALIRELTFPFTPYDGVPKKYAAVWEALQRDTASRDGLTIAERLAAETVVHELGASHALVLPLAERLVLAPRHRESLQRR